MTADTAPAQARELWVSWATRAVRAVKKMPTAAQVAPKASELEAGSPTAVLPTAVSREVTRTATTATMTPAVSVARLPSSPA